MKKKKRYDVNDVNSAEIPEFVYESLARSLLPVIQKYYINELGGLPCPAVLPVLRLPICDFLDINKKSEPMSDLDKGSDYLVVVDPRGVEPLSENRSVQPSPSASCLFEFPFPHAGKQAYGKSSFFLYDSFKSKRAVHIYR